MKHTLKTIFLAIIILGTFAVAFNILFGENTVVYVHKSLIPNTTITWYEYDTLGYVKGLETSIRDTTILQFNWPRWQWVAIDGTDWADDLGHDIAVLINYIILPINILLWPLKLGAYIFRFLLSLVGLNYNDPSSSVYWMGQLINALKSIEIPYIGGNRIV